MIEIADLFFQIEDMYKKAHAAIRKDPEHKKPAAKKARFNAPSLPHDLAIIVSLCVPGGQEEVDCEEAHARREEGQGGQGEAGLPLPDRGPEGLTSLYSILAIVIVVLNKLALIVENRE